MTWTNLTSNTTARNTSRFVLLSPVSYDGGYVNLQPAIRSSSEDARGGGFYLTSTDPIALHTSGESTL